MIEAQNLLTEMRLSDYPNMKKDARKNWHRQIHKAAFPNQKPAEALTTTELAAAIEAQLRG